MPRESLGEFEHQVLLTIMQLGGSGYSAPIVTDMETRAGKAIAPAAVYIALRRLEQRGLVHSEKEDPRPNEGGRGKRIFHVTDTAVAKLRDSRRTMEKFWDGLDPLFQQR